MLNKEQQRALDLVKEGKNVFITGAAGTGKSFLINHMKDELDIDITASTGIAATNIGGMTLHSWAGIYPFNNELRTSRKPDVLARIRNCKILVIDEISMIDDRLLDFLDDRLRETNYAFQYEPFGGIQIVVVGDFMQLPPISRDAKYCFNSKAWKSLEFEFIKLTQIERQKEKEMADFLNNVRFKTLGSSDYEILKRISTNKPCSDDYVKLYARNKECDEENGLRLKAINEEVQVYHADIDMIRPDLIDKQIEHFFKGSLIAEQIAIKKGARVMMLSNEHIEQGISNGSIGTVIGTVLSDPLVKFDNGCKITINRKKIPINIKDPETRKIVKVAEISQIPLRLAYAITSHKAQGMTLEKVDIDFKHFFAPFQAYVALSRCKTLDSLKIRNMRMYHIKIDQEAVDFMNNL